MELFFMPLTTDADLALRALLPWSISFVFITLAVYVTVLAFPAERERRIFAAERWWLSRFLRGDFSLRYTLLLGGGGACALAWWCRTMGLWPPPDGVRVMAGLWGAGVALSLANAGRKSHVSGAAGLLLALVIGGLLVLSQWMGTRLLLGFL